MLLRFLQCFIRFNFSVDQIQDQRQLEFDGLLQLARHVIGNRRIETRFDEMLRLGLSAELKKLRDDYGLESGMPSMRCVGYRQAWDYLDGRIGATALREQGIAATRQLAKRQLTWLRSMNDVTEFDCLAEDLPDMVLEYLRRELEAMYAGG